MTLEAHVKKTLCVLLVTLAASCSRSSPKGESAGGATAPVAPVTAPRQAKDLLADGKAVAAYAAYQKEIAPHSKKMMEAFMDISAKAGGDVAKIEEAGKNDPRILELQKLDAAALAKAGISKDDAQTLSQALSPYLAEVYMAQGAADQAAQVKAADDKFVAEYGAAALASVKQNQAALLAGQEAVMSAVMAK